MSTKSRLEASDAPMPTIHGIYWLKRNAKTDRMLHIMKWVSYLLPVAVVMVLAYSYFRLGLDHPENLSPAKQAKLETLKQAVALMVLALAGFPILVTVAFGNLRRHLGTDGHRFYVRMGDGTQTSFSPEQAIYGWREIRFRDLAVPVQTGKGQWLYAEGELETYIAPLLRRATKLGPLALIRYELAHPDRVMIVTALYLSVLFVVLFASGLADKMFSARR